MTAPDVEAATAIAIGRRSANLAAAMPPQSDATRAGPMSEPRPNARLTRRAVLVLGAAGLLSACSAKGPAPGITTTPAELTTASILAAVNDVRKSNGRPPLRYNHQLEQAARSQARLMASRDQLSHDLGVTLRERVSAAGYEGAVGENVAGGHRTLEQAIQGWLDSPRHRDTLLSTRFVEFGLAVASVPAGRSSRYGMYWAFIAGGSFDAWRVYAT